MGIKGLHKALSFCTVKDNLRNYRNAIIAVDTSSWMHKSVYSISEEFVEMTDSGRLDQKCIHVSARYIIKRCKELIECFGIRAVYLVLDGKRIPLKADESKDRDEKRRQNLAEARMLKRNGERWKAEDKYKSCIRIKDGFTAAVVREVKRELSNYGRVHFVHSPHEADSQLTRLVLDGVADAVITEDSDILVYSAAAHVVFPVLFKLDRNTGNCDCIKMDWLLSLTSEEASKPVTSTNTLEVMFRRLAARQAKRKGFGVRLFVQGCILSGCDYRKSLEGVGPTNAFKLVRDNAFRNDSVRFRKILESLPKKVKQKIDIDEYEQILAKSEAIFFYHPVLHTDGKIKPLLQPRISLDETGEEHHYTDHYPFMSRFEGDWSFLGTRNIESNDAVEHPSAVETALEPTKLPKASPWVQIKKRDSSQAVSHKHSKIIQNPYNKSKLSDKKILPLQERNINSRISPGKKNVSNRQQQSPKLAGPISKFLTKPDVRYAKRKFSPTARTGTMTKKRPFSAVGSTKKTPAQSFFLPRATKREKSPTSTKYSESGWPKYDSNLYETSGQTNFSYPSPDKSKSEENFVSTKDKEVEKAPFYDSSLQDFYDLTHSNSNHSDNVDDGAANESVESKNVVAEKDEAPFGVPSDAVATDDTAADTNPHESAFYADQSLETDHDEEMPTTSKYFSAKTTKSRRVTLDAGTSPLASENSNDECKTSIDSQSSGSGAITTSGKEGQGRSGSSNNRSIKNRWMRDIFSSKKRVRVSSKKV